MRKKVFYGLVAVLVFVIGWNYELLRYGFFQAKGQLTLIQNTRETTEVLSDKSVSDSVKHKIRLINEIRQFAFDSLGIHRNDNYTTFYDQKGKPLLWVVTACPPFAMKAYEWNFPILGNVSYKGFFDYKKAQEEEKQLKDAGFDTDIGEVSAWSTLGWLKDPILSSMLNRKPGNLANLIIHELTHGTLYVKDNVEFNENLASFVGDFGARQFLKQKYGDSSVEYKEYEKSLILSKAFSEKTLYWAKNLDSLYRSYAPSYSLEEKQKQKAMLINKAKEELIRLQRQEKKMTPKQLEAYAKINNTFFVDYMTYHAQQNAFEAEFTNVFKRNFPAYMHYLKEKYPSI